MPQKTLSIFRLLVVPALCMWLVSTLVSAEDISPSHDSSRIAVSHFSLDGFSAMDNYPLDISKLREHLVSLRGQYPPAMSVDEMHQVADAMTLHMRNLGYVFHTVYLPPQRVEQGLVQLKLQEGVLADVHVLNQTRWKSQRFEKVFEPLLGQLLYGPAVEERVQALKAQPGVRVFAFYSRGAKGGEARLNLRVEEASKRSFSAKADNHGTPASGVYRAIGQYSEYQLTGRFDRLSLAVLRTLDEVDNTYGSLNYALPFGRLNYLWDVTASNNQFELGDRFAALGLKGDAIHLGAGLTRILEHHPTRRERVRLGAHRKKSNLDTDFASVEQETSHAVTLEWSRDKHWLATGTLFNGSLGLSYGTFSTATLEDESFGKLDLSGTLVKGLGQGRWRSVLHTSLRGQYSKADLPSVEGLTLTGAYGVRGFESSLFSADRAVLATIEWSLPNLITSNPQSSLRLEPLLFADWGLGSQLETDGTTDREGQFAGAGAGLRFSWGRHFSGQATVAAPLRGDVNNRTVEDDELWLFEVRWH